MPPRERGAIDTHFFTPELQQRALRKRNMIKDLRAAIQQQQFEIYYQPIIDMQSDMLNKAEALLRWHHPESGLVSPSVFIPNRRGNRPDF